MAHTALFTFMQTIDNSFVPFEIQRMNAISLEQKRISAENIFLLFNIIQ